MIDAMTFGALPDGSSIEMYTLRNTNGMEVRFLNLGGTICALRVPDRHGAVVDVTPGYDALPEYVEDQHYLGALVGRFASRISRSRFTIDGHVYSLTPNDGTNLLHGGARGLNRAVWRVEPFSAAGHTGAVLTYTSPDGEGGFPGTLQLRVTYTLTEANELSFAYLASTDRATPVNLMQHFYLNLGGHDSGDVLDHELTIHADNYLEADEDRIPSGRILSVADTSFDFRSPRRIGDVVGEEASGDGFDHTFALDGSRIAAHLVHPRSGRTLEIETTEPGLHVYTGNELVPAVHGKGGAHYGKHAALALETQHYPDSPNIPAFPNTILRPGSEFASRTVYRFGT